MDSERRLARRQAQNRQRARRQRRTLAALGLLGAAVAVVVAVLIAGKGASGSSARDASHSASASRQVPSGHLGGSAGASGAGASAGAATAGDQPRDVAAPILMYHVINPPPAGAPFPGLYVSTAEFQAQMHALAAAGFHAVTQDQLAAHWRTGAPLPAGKPVVVSFDNGYQSQYTNALPVLRALGWDGVENIQLTGLPPSQGGLSEAQVRSLVADGWELNTQGVSHADLITLDPTQLHEQVAGARATIQARYHVPVNWFCYPSGHYDATVVAEVKAAGYSGSTTVVPGWASPASDPYRLPRLRVLGGTTPTQLLSELAAIRNDPSPPASYSG